MAYSLADDVSQYLPEVSDTTRLAFPINVEEILRTGSCMFEVQPPTSIDAPYDEEEEDYRLIELEDAIEEGLSGRQRPVKDDSYLRDTSVLPFKIPQEGLEVEDLLEDGSVKKVMIREGTGVQLPDDGKVFYHYTMATLGDNKSPKIFDSTTNPGRNRPESADFRNLTMIPGLFVALSSMKLFEVAKFLIRSEQAFGAMGCPPRVPPSTDIVCIIEVISFLDGEKLKMIDYMTAHERKELPFTKIFEFASRKKQEGNTLYRKLNYRAAKRCYFVGINVLEDYPVFDEDDNKRRQERLLIMYHNLAQVCLKLEQYPQACVACKNGLRCVPDEEPEFCARLLYRFAIAKRNLGEPGHALRLIDDALKKDPKNRSIKEERMTIMECIKAERELERQNLESEMDRDFHETKK